MYLTYNSLIFILFYFQKLFVAMFPSIPDENNQSGVLMPSTNIQKSNSNADLVKMEFHELYDIIKNQQEIISSRNKTVEKMIELQKQSDKDYSRRISEL